MDTARQIATAKLLQIMTDLTTVRQGDSYTQIADRLLSVNGKEASATTLIEISVMLSDATNAATLQKGQSLLQDSLLVRTKSIILKRELDQFARTLLEQERQRVQSTWKQPQILPLILAQQNNSAVLRA